MLLQIDYYDALNLVAIEIHYFAIVWVLLHALDSLVLKIAFAKLLVIIFVAIDLFRIV